MKILVTGANGQLGRELQCLAQEGSRHTFCFCNRATLDITYRDDVMRRVAREQPDAVVNCAAFTAVDPAEDDAQTCREVNALAPGYLAEAAAANGARMVHISTDYVFDGNSCVPYREDDETHPATVYGATKLEGEKQVQKHCSEAVIVRTAWLYSPFGNNFVKTMLRLGRERDRLNVVFDQVGTPTYAKDLALAIIAMLEAGAVSGIYHYTNEGVCSWYDFVKTIHQMAGIDSCQVNPIHTHEYPAKAARPHYSVLDKTKIKQTYPIEIPYWTDSLKDCLQRMR